MLSVQLNQMYKEGTGNVIGLQAADIFFRTDYQKRERAKTGINYLLRGSHVDDSKT